MSGVRQFDEQIILPVVLDVFWRNGWQASSLVEIARATGVQRGSLYNAYGSKDELFLHAYALYTRHFIQSVTEAMQGSDLQEVLHKFFKTALSNMTMGTPSKGCLTTKMLIEIELTSMPVQQSIKTFMQELKEVLCLHLSRPELAVSLALKPSDAADVIVTFVRGIAVMERISEEPEQLMSTCETFIHVITR
ncbi:TetR/AcrR family transcriptional regulator [Acinetobacter stercoris]|uniref:HTH-type transcriptional repressor ComR n=1 Tax=Acinetobacter stercoris TaxID=2126983 RepID=A0A2U3MWP5_9GAMM|nr:MULTISPECIES: TetR/AcrR family transcriptional regulator [Acinetobacter]SPL69857.1 HTH-type transcriptional repressor ComR [Acinetobacter stercoris]